MKTKDFIKILQEADPTGEHHVRFHGYGVPVGAALVEGYWDGAYQYIDENGIFIETTEGNKVDIFTIDKDDIIWEEDGDMDILKQKFKPDFECYSDPIQKKEKYDNFWKNIEEEAKQAKKCVDETEKRFITNIISDINNGYTFIFNTDAAHKYSSIKKVKFFIKEICNIGEHDALLDNPDIFELSIDSIRCMCNSNIKIFKLIKK